MGEGQSCDTDQDLDLGAWTGPPGRTYKYILGNRVAEVAWEHGWHPPKSLDSDENFKPEHYFVANLDLS